MQIPRFFLPTLIVAMCAWGAVPAIGQAETKVITADQAREAPQADKPRRFMLRDVTGRVLTDQDFRGRYLLVYFGYTSCPDVCPTTLLTVSEVMKLLGEMAARVTPIFITVDPDRDTPEILAEYVSAFDPRIIALTGPKPFIDAAVASYNVYYRFIPDPKAPDDYTVDHTASLAFVAPDGHLITRFLYGQPADAIQREIRKVLAGDATLD